MYKPYSAKYSGRAGGVIKVPVGPFMETMNAYNRGAAGNTDVKMQILDGLTTRGVTPPKTNWALPIDKGPFYALPLAPGITFTYMGVAVDERARVLDSAGRPFKNVYAAGEIMTGNVLTKGYLGGIGLAMGAIFGELAGRDAATNGRS